MPRDLEFDVDTDEDDDEGSADAAAQLAKAKKDLARLGKENRDLLKERREVEEYKAQIAAEDERKVLAEAFEDVGLPGKLAGLFLATNPNADIEELTEDEVFEWATQYGIEVVDQDGEAYRPGEAEDEVEEGVGEELTPIPTGGAKTPKGLISREDWLKQAAVDPEAARAALNAGRVDQTGLRDGLGPAK